MLFSGIGSFAANIYEGETNQYQFTLETNSIDFKQKGNFVLVTFPNQDSFVMNDGKPMLPMTSKQLQFPVGTIIESINVNIETDSIHLDHKIFPAPNAQILHPSVNLDNTFTLDTKTYECNNFYPEESFFIKKGVGRLNEDIVLFITVNIPARYNPVTDTLNIPTEVEIEVTHSPPKTDILSADEYDLLLITDESFESSFQPLVEHKNSHGVRTIMESVQDIISAYDGRDDAERIKLRIKDAIEEWGIDYVILGGGRNGQSFDWMVPSRRSNNEGSGWESGYESDLYFADIYKIEDDEIVFEDWDPNGNGIFAEYTGMFGSKDEPIDYYPDVHVGRIPARSITEVEQVVNKIIDYENNADNSWYKRAVMIGGDTSPPERGGSPNYFEGELETGLAASHLERAGFNVEKLWTSTGTMQDSSDVITAISQGEGYVFMTGHGNPASLGTYLPNAESEDEFPSILTIFEMNKLKNDGKLPIVVVGGCHNAQFNVTLKNILKDIREYGLSGYLFSDPYRFFYMEWVPRCFTEWMVTQAEGGAIGTIGCSGLGIGYINDGWNVGLSGWLDPHFFNCIANESIETFGQAHDQAITDYINIIGRVNDDYADRKTIEEWTLLGDPSLKLGGYN